ncbi:hypothetical protein C2S53_016640 [Perilla frutescens var. hirtella]|uniref:Uncharacterized protein n=1 Tax=Perilla frutescens var. hirtella TaxID=608512 RepID=A0AAD4IX63_PERFH|nr:hypothetical protein C2S53_016640 [Perilla frutescens var. hirtella]
MAKTVESNCNSTVKMIWEGEHDSTYDVPSLKHALRVYNGEWTVHESPAGDHCQFGQTLRLSFEHLLLWRPQLIVLLMESMEMMLYLLIQADIKVSFEHLHFGTLDYWC